MALGLAVNIADIAEGPTQLQYEKVLQIKDIPRYIANIAIIAIDI